MHYVSTKSASERRNTLKKWFNFDCKCGACSGGGGCATDKRSVEAEDELLRTALADYKVSTKSGHLRVDQKAPLAKQVVTVHVVLEWFLGWKLN